MRSCASTDDEYQTDNEVILPKKAIYFDTPVLVERYETTVHLNFGGSKQGNLILIREV